MSTINHYGKWINSEEPTTGVLSINEINWEFMDYELVCLDCEHSIDEHYKHANFDSYSENCPNCLECGGYCLDWLDCYSSHTKLHGDWIKDTNTGLYEPDKNGEYSAIENESTVQVVWSIYTSRGNPCSPCYPGQVEFSNDGDFLAYTLPPELLYSDDK